MLSRLASSPVCAGMLYHVQLEVLLRHLLVILRIDLEEEKNQTAPPHKMLHNSPNIS